MTAPIVQRPCQELDSRRALDLSQRPGTHLTDFGSHILVHEGGAEEIHSSGALDLSQRPRGHLLHLGHRIVDQYPAQGFDCPGRFELAQRTNSLHPNLGVLVVQHADHGLEGVCLEP